MKSGADMAAQSTHKLLGSLTQTSMLHIGVRELQFLRINTCFLMLAMLLAVFEDPARLYLAFP